MSIKVLIMSGISGSGKSTYAEKTVLGLADSFIVSADDYFMSNGAYIFDQTKLSEAHGVCFKKFIQLVQREVGMVVVDNTNTTATEIAPHILGAQAFGHRPEIITVKCDDVEMAAKRNRHGVPLNVVQAQHERLLKRELPPWWKNTEVSV